MSKTKLIIGAVVSVLIVLAVTLSVFLTKPKARPVTPSPSPSATSDPYAADRAVIAKWSGELAAKFTTYTRPDRPDYYDSLKPYLTPGYFSQLTGTNSRLAGRATHIVSLHSSTKQTFVTNISKNSADARVTVTTSESGGQTYEQVIAIHWVRTGQRWAADSVGSVSSTKRY